MRKYRRYILIFVILFIGAVWLVFFARGPLRENISWGITFSIPQAESLGLDWKEVFAALLDNLKVKKFRLIAEWDGIEPENGHYDFSNIDWQVNEIKKRDGQAIVVIGIKTPRWPECHIPQWATKLKEDSQKKAIIDEIKAVVSHFASSSAVKVWQVENEPFFNFGKCPWMADKNFVKEEIAAVRQIDSSRPIMITDSGEWSWFWNASRLGNIVGTTLYRRVWFGPLKNYITYPFGSAFYSGKIYLAEKLFGKKFINVELQAEPWTMTGLKNTPAEEIKKTFSLKQFQENIDFARHAGEDEIYLWGAEWWYYMKENGHPEYWEEAGKLF